MGTAPREVQEEGRIFTRDIQAEHRGTAHTAGNWPMLSDAFAVDPDARADASREAAQKGVPTDFAPDGRAIFRDAAHRRDYCRAYHAFDRNAGFSDPTPR
jgi:hypothetical protein